MNRFAYSVREYLCIVRALKIGSARRPLPVEVWGSPYVKEVKDRFKAHKRIEQKERCCYCQRSIRGECKMVLDIEHILPKSIFSHCIFDLPNLAVSCRRCNMDVKRASVKFLNGDPLHLTSIDKAELFKPDLYKFAHPNLVSVYKHIQIRQHLIGAHTILFYKVFSPVGEYTYDFFKLKDFETDSLDTAQGLTVPQDDDLYEYVRALEREIYN